MGFVNSCQRILNLDRRAAQQQRVQRQSKIQISVHIGLITPNTRGVKSFFHFLNGTFGIGSHIPRSLSQDRTPWLGHCPMIRRFWVEIPCCGGQIPM